MDMLSRLWREAHALPFQGDVGAWKSSLSGTDEVLPDVMVYNYMPIVYEVFTLPHTFWLALISKSTVLISVSVPLSPARLAGKGLSNGSLRSVQRWSECSALISVLSAESLKLMYALSGTEWRWTELSFTSVEQKNEVFTIKKEITTPRIDLWTSWKKSHDQKLAISTCTMLPFIADRN